MSDTSKQHVIFIIPQLFVIPSSPLAHVPIHCILTRLLTLQCIMPPELAEKVGLLVVHSFGCTASFTQVINVLPSNLIIVSSSSIIRKWV